VNRCLHRFGVAEFVKSSLGEFGAHRRNEIFGVHNSCVKFFATPLILGSKGIHAKIRPDICTEVNEIKAAVLAKYL
jgi:hypothetical protein